MKKAKLPVNSNWRNLLISIRNNNFRVCVCVREGEKRREKQAVDIRAHRHMHCTYTFPTLSAKRLRKLWNNLVVKYIHFF